MKNRILISIIFFILILFSGIFCFFYNSQIIKISLLFQNKSCYDIDSIWAKSYIREFLSIKGIKEVYSVSSYDSLNIYIKLNPFLLNKEKIINRIKIKFDILFNNINFYNENILVDFDYEYGKKTDYYLVFSFLENDFEDFIDFENVFVNDFLVNYKVSEISIFPMHPFSTYLYFDYEILRRFRLDITKLRQIIDSNNNNFNYFYKISDSKIYGANISSDIDNINDVKNIVIPFVKNEFSIKLEDIIDIQNNLRFLCNSKIIYKNNNSIIFKINKKRFYPSFLFEYKINNYIRKNISNLNNVLNYKLINTNNLAKLHVIPDNSISLEELCAKISSNIKNDEALYFLGIDNPKISRKDFFEETGVDKFIILSHKKSLKNVENALNKLNLIYSKNPRRILIQAKNLNELDEKIQTLKEKHENHKINLTKKDTVIFYKIDNYFLNDYAISKSEVVNSLIAHDDGLIIDYYLNSYHTIPIIIKNKQNNLSSYVYSTKDNILLDSNSFASIELKRDYIQIARKNNEFFAFFDIY